VVRDDEVAELRRKIEEMPDATGVALTQWKIGDEDYRLDVAADIKRKLSRRGVEASEESVFDALKSLFEPSPTLAGEAAVTAEPESELLAFRRAEFNVVRSEVNDPARIPNLRVISVPIPDGLSPWIARVNLVERLRETRAFFGFDRLEQNPQAIESMPDAAMNQLFLDPPVQAQERWLPAVAVFGEGLYFELSEDRIADWQDANADWLKTRLSDSYVARLAGVFQVLPPLSAADRKWASKYLLLHSLAHVLINQLVFECGYNTASLRERLYVSCDGKAPMGAVLIYTAAGDSEGTLGGLVRLGRPERFGPVVRRALSRASWCSADPVCSENLGGQGSRLVNLAACHGCILLPETSCETVNQGLDRAMIVGEPENRAPGFMAEILEQLYTLE